MRPTNGRVNTRHICIVSSKFFDSSLSDEKLMQEFSVVATGAIDSKCIEFDESQKLPCANYDPDHLDRCLCEEDYIGPLCQTKIEHTVDQESFYAKL